MSGNFFKTPKGTELPFMDLRGRRYLQIMHRLVWFREVHPEWSIITHSMILDENKSVFRAEIINDQGRCIQTGYGQESQKDFADHLEKAETKAIGRALAACGFGTQFAPELDEGERLADSPAPKGFSSGPPLGMAFGMVAPGRDTSEYVIRFGKYSGKTFKEVPLRDLESYQKYLEDGSRKNNRPLGDMALEFIGELQSFKQQPEPSVHGDDQIPF